MKTILDYAGIVISVCCLKPSTVKHISDFMILGGCETVLRASADLCIDIEIVKNIDRPPFDKASNSEKLLRVKIPGFMKEVYILENKIYFYFGVEEVLFVLDKKNDLLKVFLIQEDMAANPRFLNVLFMDVLHYAFRFYGIYFIHAAGLERDGMGLLLAGASHQGKSMLSLQLITGGFNFLSDDKVGLRNSKEGIEMMFSPEWMGLASNASDLFKNIKREIDAHSVPVAVFSSKVKLPVARVFPERMARTALCRVMVVLKLSPSGKLKMEEIPKMEILADLFRENIVLFGDQMAGDACKIHPDILCRMVEQVKMFRLTYSLDNIREAGSLISKSLPDS